MIAAANVAPTFHHRQRLVAEDLRRLADPCVIFEHTALDSDGDRFYVYTVGGWLDGKKIGDFQGGCTVAGEVIIIHARNREEADYLAADGLGQTINALDREDELYMEAHAAQARLASVGPIERIDQATKPLSDMSDRFVEDVAKIRPLIGDDIILTTGKGLPPGGPQ
jgi:hypothetical protein